MGIHQLYILAALLLAISVEPSPCKPQQEKLFHNNAEILSMDLSTRPCNVHDPCNCPGGYFINIDRVPDPHGKCIGCTSFKTMKFPEGFTLSDTEKFPVAVIIDWKYDELNCDSSRIIITKIERISDEKPRK